MTSGKEKPLPLITVKTLLAISITLAFLIAVEYFIGFNKILDAWQQLSWPTIILAFGLLFLSYVMRATRIHSYYNMKSASEFLLCIKATLQHNFYNNFLPMRSGELSFPILLKRYFSIEISNSIGALFVFRLLDLHILAAISLLCGIFLFPSMILVISILFGAWCVLPLALLRFRIQIEHRLQDKELDKILSLFHKVLISLPKTQTQLLKAYFWTAINWLIKLAVLSWIFMQFQSMPTTAALISVIFGDLTSVLPIHGVAGAGTYEAGVLLGASFFNLDPQAIVAAAVNMHLFILGSSALAILVSPLITQKKRIKLQAQ